MVIAEAVVEKVKAASTSAAAKRCSLVKRVLLIALAG